MAMDVSTAPTVGAAGITAIKEGIELTKTLLSKGVSQEVQAALLEISIKLIDAHAAIFTLNEKVSEQRKELVVLKESMSENGNYLLSCIGAPELGQFAYKYIVDQTGVPESRRVPEHYICQKCFDKRGVKIVLQLNSHGIWQCDDCFTEKLKARR